MAERVAAATGGRVVKAFNTVFADNMAQERLSTVEVAAPGYCCGDDESAKQKVVPLLEAGFEVHDFSSRSRT